MSERTALSRTNPKSRWHSETEGQVRHSWACIPLTHAVYEAEAAARQESASEPNDDTVYAIALHARLAADLDLCDGRCSSHPERRGQGRGSPTPREVARLLHRQAREVRRSCPERGPDDAVRLHLSRSEDRAMTYWHDDPSTHPPVGTWMWHLHHEILCELLTEPLQNRLDYIRSDKPASEVPTRLACIDIVKGELPADLVTARAAYDKAQAAYNKAAAAYNKAAAAYDKAGAAYDKAGAAYNKAWAAVTARAAYDKAWAAYNKAWAAVTARAAYDKAWAASLPALEALYDKAWAASLPALEALHVTEHPDCPWNGRTIFP
jgi:hypothetical protein